MYDELERLNLCSIYKDNEGRIRKQERDVFKALKKDNIRFVAIGIENQSDFGILADFFVQKRKTGDYIPSEKKIVHKEEFIMLMSVLTGDERYQSVKFCEGGEGNMCEILDYYIGVGEKRGYELGEKCGYELGEKHGLLMGIRILLADGCTVSEISKKMNLKEKFVEELIKED